uniref:Orc1-like AAA ATPase domain-containing protein n=1 Tax=Aegilops tauschii subsp. strangulata TaxID=200361 RepID=A0A453P810_AEGTS
STSPSPIDLAAAADAPGGRTSGSVYRPPVVKTRTTLNSSAGGRRGSLVGAAPKAAPTPKETALSTYGRDMTVVAGMTDPVIGRDDEIDRVVCILCRRTKNSALLVGAPGVGKTAIAEGLARRIAGGMVPAALAGARVVETPQGCDQGSGGCGRPGSSVHRRGAHACRPREDQGRQHGRRQPAEAGIGPRSYPMRGRSDFRRVPQDASTLKKTPHWSDGSRRCMWRSQARRQPFVFCGG